MSHYLSYEPYQLNGIIEFIGKHSKEPCVQTSGVTGSIVIPWINWILEYENGFNRIYKVILCMLKKIQLSILFQIHARPKPFMAYQRILQYHCWCLHCHIPNVISVSNYLQSILFVVLKKRSILAQYINIYADTATIITSAYSHRGAIYAGNYGMWT